MCLAIIAVALLLVRLEMFGKNERRDKQKQIVLLVHKLGDKTRTLPGSALYKADLFNQTDETIILQAVKMPGGYVGEGQFFYCSLDVWKPDQHRWALLWSSHAGLGSSSSGVSPGANLKDIGLKAGERIEVCGLMLPTQAGKDGACVRYRLRTRWKRDHSQRTLLSDPFVIGDDASAQRTPCSGK
jgi:hypothetical protein